MYVFAIQQSLYSAARLGMNARSGFVWLSKDAK